MRVLAVTGSRADWGLLQPVLAALRDDPRFVLVLAATGQHMMGDRSSLAAISEEGFVVDHAVDIGLSEQDDGAHAVTAAMASAVAGLGAAIAAARPDLLLVLGDRYEILAAASASVLARVPVAHLCGGDVTRGAMDDAFRHAITKLSALHFVTNEAAADRVRQMGEAPERIFTVGSPGLDRLKAIRPLERAGFFEEMGLPPGRPLFLVTFHPPTLSADAAAQAAAMFAALDTVPDARIVVTGSNADPGGREIDALVSAYASSRDGAVYRASLGSALYAAGLTHADAVIGNSSSGLYEAPSFGTPTVNIGDRQEGRLRAPSVIDCAPDAGAISAAISSALERGKCPGMSPYGDGCTVPRIVEILGRIGDTKTLIRKTFRELADA